MGQENSKRSMSCTPISGETPIKLKESVKLRLQNIQIREIKHQHRTIITIPSNETLIDAYQKLLTNNILSAPVEKSDHKGYVGYLDIRSLASSIMSMYRDRMERDCLDNSSVMTFVVELTQGKNQLEVWTPTYLAKIYPIHYLTNTSTLFQLCEILSKGTRRVALSDENGKITQIISQSWLMDALVPIMCVPDCEISINQIGITNKNVFFIQLSDTAADAFSMMERYSISGVAVLDNEKRLVGQLTAADLAIFLYQKELRHLSETVETFSHGKFSLEYGKEICVHLETSVAAVIKRFSETKSHRLFIVDEGQHLKGICSLKDIFFALLN
eukprot:c17865_g1_i1.p1 GENE.c17865_g1_i1~~c17865_g1_i1.p1  ORF type:complete len:329 (+),score=131.07 c17865_g1_i1:65-1051(+)